MITYCDRGQHMIGPNMGYVILEGTGDSVCHECIKAMPKAQLKDLHPIEPEQLAFIQKIEATAS